MDSFEGKVGLVTGGGRGIGHGICLALADAGANLIVADIDFDNAARVAEEVTDKRVRRHCVPTLNPMVSGSRSLGQGIGDFSNVDHAGPDTRAHLFKPADRLCRSDSSFRPIPAKYSLLSARTVPSWGGNTGFADMRQTRLGGDWPTIEQAD